MKSHSNKNIQKIKLIPDVKQSLKEKIYFSMIFIITMKKNDPFLNRKQRMESAVKKRPETYRKFDFNQSKNQRVIKLETLCAAEYISLNMKKLVKYF